MSSASRPPSEDAVPPRDGLPNLIARLRAGFTALPIGGRVDALLTPVECDALQSLTAAPSGSAGREAPSALKPTIPDYSLVGCASLSSAPDREAPTLVERIEALKTFGPFVDHDSDDHAMASMEVDEGETWIDREEVLELVRAARSLPDTGAAPPRWAEAGTAPRDGSHILVTQIGKRGFGICGGAWQDWCAVVHYWPVAGEEGFYLSSGNQDDSIAFSHWSPLPEQRRCLCDYALPNLPGITHQPHCPFVSAPAEPSDELPYAAVSHSAPDGRAMEWAGPLWDAIHNYMNSLPSDRRAPTVAITQAVHRAMRLAIETAAPRAAQVSGDSDRNLRERLKDILGRRVTVNAKDNPAGLALHKIIDDAFAVLFETPVSGDSDETARELPPTKGCCAKCGRGVIVTRSKVNDIVCTNVTPVCECNDSLNLWPGSEGANHGE